MASIIDEFFQTKNTEYDVNIIIGENGSGKSFFLNKVAKEFLKSGKTVIAISTSVHDKFEVRNPRFHFFGGRQGRNMVTKIIKKSLCSESKVGVDRVKSLQSVLEYGGYNSRIGVLVKGFNSENIPILEREESLDKFEKYDLMQLLLNYSETFRNEMLVPIDLRHSISGKIESTSISSILKYEQLMRKHNILSRVYIFLEREYQDVELTNASSGELMLMSTLMHISANIDNNSVILIDEPENSLHPKWQQEYIRKILDVFYYQQPKIVIATHSPLIIPLKDQHADLFRLCKYELQKIDRTTSNNEEVLSNVFGIITPENRYLSDQMVNVINLYDSGMSTYDVALCKVLDCKSKVYDKKQEEFLDGIIDIMSEIRNSKVKTNAQ